MAKAAGGAKASQSAKSFPQALYDMLTRTSAAQWDAVLRHPWFLRPVSLYINGVLTLLERTRALMGFGLRMMNLPTREEIAALDHKLTALHDRLDDLTAHLTDVAAPKRAARATTAQRASSAKGIAGRKEKPSPTVKPASPSGRKRAARKAVEAASVPETISTSDAASSSS
ncbi:MAG: hypothetical protein NZ585_07770 [Chloracidobacterium sp.]|nr:hypothetical protein [Chloracidobacterium sp.]MDW8218092.1 hypothetical protein [Acidobacteriota bacterium]